MFDAKMSLSVRGPPIEYPMVGELLIQTLQSVLVIRSVIVSVSLLVSVSQP
jgi:hypothetical protein